MTDVQQDSYAGRATAGLAHEDALALLTDAYRAHRTAVRSLALRICGSGGAEDVTQEVFMRLWRDPGRFDPARGSIRTFLLTMTHHMAVDRIRSTTARHRREVQSLTADSAISDVEGEALLGQVRERIVAAVDALPAPEKEAIRTAFYGDCTYREAARILRQPEGTTKSRIRSGLKRLEVSLAADLFARLD